MLCFSTEDLPMRDRLSLLRESVGRQATNTDIIPLDDNFRVELTRQTLPGLTVMKGGNTPHRFEGPFDLSRASDDLVLLWMDAPGEMLWRQRGNEIVLHNGVATLMSASEKRVGENHSLVSYTTIKMERALLAPLVADPESVMLRPIASNVGALSLLKHYIQGIKDPLGEDVQKAVATHIYDLVALSLGTTRDSTELIKGRGLRAVRLNAVRKLAQENLWNHAYSINDAALILGLTPRTIQLLFKEEGTTFSGYLQAERLAKAYRQLENRNMAVKPISSIAYDVGFGDLSHFNHMFRRAYGETPSDVRQRTLMQVMQYVNVSIT